MATRLRVCFVEMGSLLVVVRAELKLAISSRGERMWRNQAELGLFEAEIIAIGANKVYMAKDDKPQAQKPKIVWILGLKSTH